MPSTFEGHWYRDSNIVLGIIAKGIRAKLSCAERFRGVCVCAITLMTSSRSTWADLFFCYYEKCIPGLQRATLKWHGGGFRKRSLTVTCIAQCTHKDESYTRKTTWRIFRAEKTMTATDVTGFDAIFSTGFFATFSRFWGARLSKLHINPGEKAKKNPVESLQWRRRPEIADFSVPCRGRTCPDIWSCLWRH